MSGLRPGSSRHAKAVRGLGRLLSLYRSAGRAEHREDGVHSTGQSMEQLEARILLGGDHPSFDLPLDAMSGTEIVIDGVTGEGDEDGIIEDVTPDLSDDLFRFVAPQDDFVTVWADTINGGGSTLDSRVEVYGIDGTLISAGSSQGQLTEGFFDDGWTSFIAEAGETYFVVVRSDVDNAGQLSTGSYTIRVDAITNTDLVIETDPMAVPPARFGAGEAAGNITLPGDDIVYRVETGSDAAFDSLASFYAALPSFPPSDFDPRLDVYDEQGQFITGDSLTGRLQTAFSVVESSADATFFVRVRGDEFTPGGAQTTGQFILRAEAAATQIDIDPVSRRGEIFDGIADGFDTRLYRFTTQGGGLTFAGAFPAGLIPLLDPAVRMYDQNTDLIGFSDLPIGADLQIQLETDTEYFIVIENFDTFNGGTYNVFIESNATFIPTQDVDDHVSRPEGDDPDGNELDFDPAAGFGDPTQFDFIRGTFEEATPLRWSDPFLYTRTFVDPNGIFDDVVNPVSDRSYVQEAVGTGRIHSFGDTDLFQFTVPVDMLGGYEGDNDDVGDALFAGGQGQFIIKGTDNDTGAPITRDFLGIWDAQDWWPVRAGVDMTILAMESWTYDPNREVGGTALIIGGEFQFADFQTAPFIAAYWYDDDPTVQEYVLTPLPFNPGGDVRSLHVWDASDADDEEAQLFIGGDFGLGVYGSIAEGDPIFAGSYVQLLDGTGGSVRALDNIDFVDPEMGDETPDTLYVGSDGGTLRSIFYDEMAEALVLGGTFIVGGVGDVNALQTHLIADPYSMEDELVPALAVGGEFNALGGVGSSNIALLQFNPGGMGGLGAFEVNNMGGGTDGPVLALDVWDRDADGDAAIEELVVGGDFSTGGGGALNNIGSFTTGFGWAALGTALGAGGGPPGTNGPVHTINVFVDGEFGVGVAPFDTNPVVYIGGDFTIADGLPAARLAQLTYDPFILDWTWTPMGLGSTDTVFALENFNDEIPTQWDRDDRRAASLRLTVSGDFLPGVDTEIRIYDSSFRIVYTNDILFPPGPPTDPSGSLDPSLLDPNAIDESRVIEIGDDQDVQFFAGEVYYLEISSVGGNGRYTFSMISDALPPDTDGDQVFDDVIGSYAEPIGMDLDRAEFDDPRISRIGLSSTTFGDGRNFTALPQSAYQVRNFDVTPSGWAVSQAQELGLIEDITDFDIYTFRASDTGTTEIRIATLQLLDQFVEFRDDLNTPASPDETTTISKIYDSPLDAKIRVFNNDLQLIASNDDNPGFSGTRSEQPFGSLDLVGDTLYGQGDTEIDGRIFSDRDPRVVFPTVNTEQYFIVVESGQLDTFLADPDLVDWRRATGSYELMINSSPNLLGVDDHDDFSQLFAEFYTFDTPMTIDENGDGEIRGEIRTRAGGVEDNDAFFTYSVGTGLINITVAADNPSEFRPRVTIFDTDGTLRVNPVSASSTSPAEIQFFATKGEQYVIRVDANVGEQGAYTVTIDGAPSIDDVADRHQLAAAQNIEILDFLGQGEFSGVIDSPGDTDIFRFTTPGYGDVTIDVESTSFGFDPVVRVFEVSEDPAGNPILLTIGFNDNSGPGTVNAQTQFPVTGADRTSGLTSNTYNEYYVVVFGADSEASSGSYDLTITADPTDDHPDAGEFAFASPLVIEPLTGLGERLGLIEVTGDTDLFTFNAPAGGVAVLSAVSNELSTLRPTIQVFDQDFNPVINLSTSTDDPVTGPDGAFSAASYRFSVVRGQQYFVLVGGATGTVTTDSGAYSLSATAPAADPVANETEFTIAQQIILSTETGAGQFNDAIDVPGDTDLYFFDTIADASTIPQQHTVRVDSTGQMITPILTVFDAGTSVLDTITDNGVGDLDPTAGVIEYDIVASGLPGERFFLQVELDGGSMFPTGAYVISVEGPIPDTIPTPGDDHANRGQFSLATVIGLDGRTGDAEITGRIEPSADSDLFRIDPAATGQTFVQVVTPSGALLDVDVTIFEQLTPGSEPVQIGRDTTGFQGVNAAIEFNVASDSAAYFILVSGLNSAQGEYTVRIDARPETFFLYYPEGFVNDNVSEFISLSNPSQSQSVDYTIRIFYEDSSLGSLTLVENETIDPGSRGGLTVAERGGFVFPGIVENQPYSIVIESTAPLGATFSHYDFEGAIGEAFTPVTSEEWAFARLERSPGRVESFLVFFNPNDHEVVVTLTANVGGTDVQIQQTVGASSRGGWELSGLTQLPLGVFGGMVTSAPTDATITDSIGIVAALSHYDLVDGEAFGVLGDPSGGSTFNVVPNFSSGSEVTGELVLYNPGDAPATVTITSDYVTAPLPSVSVNRSIEAGQTLVLRASDLSLAADVTAGITISSNEAIAGVALERQNGDANAIATQNSAASTWFFGDAFLNSEQAGLTYFETLSFYNPTSEAIAVEITLFFNDGTTANAVRQVGAGSFNNLVLDAFGPILDRQMLNFFSIQLTSNLPLIASLTHYDLVLDGGWTNAGAPLGLTNPLDRIVI